jgi:hypothetical protein
LQATPNVILEWEPIATGRYIGYLVTPGFLANFRYEMAYETKSGIETGSGMGQHVDPDTLPPEHRAAIEEMLERPARPENRSVWHECFQLRRRE